MLRKLVRKKNQVVGVGEEISVWHAVGRVEVRIILQSDIVTPWTVSEARETGMNGSLLGLACTRVRFICLHDSKEGHHVGLGLLGV